MSEQEDIPEWGNRLARRIVALEEKLDRLEQAPAAPGPMVAAPPPAPDANAAAEHARELGRRQAALGALEEEFQTAQARLADARRQAESAEERVMDHQRRAGEIEADLEGRRAELQTEADLLDQTRRVITLIWPRFMLTPPFAPWKESVEKSLLSEAPSSSAALLFANLHGYTACLLENDLKYLRDGLRDISRFLYAWLKESGHQESAAFEIALAWAAAFNEECTGRCEIEVPQPGTPANALSMTFPPRGSSPEVVSVRTWCVRDAQRRVIHRAEVFI